MPELTSLPSGISDCVLQFAGDTVCTFSAEFPPNKIVTGFRVEICLDVAVMVREPTDENGNLTFKFATRRDANRFRSFVLSILVQDQGFVEILRRHGIHDLEMACGLPPKGGSYGR